MSNIPGTVSKILWHFTGGPLWNAEKKKQEGGPRPVEDACKALVGILKSKELRLGSYQEVVNVTVPHLRTTDPRTNKWITEHNVPRTLTSSRVCCLADIPIMHLGYHAERYGKVAIGFHREAAIKQGFHPVFYQLHRSSILQSIYVGFVQLCEAADHDIESQVCAVREKLSNPDPRGGHTTTIDIYDLFYELEGLASVHTQGVSYAKKGFEDFLAFIKTFDETEFGTIYCEREWRSIKPFKFDYGDIAMVVLPRNLDDGEHYLRFVASAKAMGVPPTLSIVSWDDLVDH